MYRCACGSRTFHEFYDDVPVTVFIDEEGLVTSTGDTWGKDEELTHVECAQCRETPEFLDGQPQEERP